MQTTIDGIKINYNQIGTGSYVFLLHGWGANLDLYNNIAQVISNKYTVVSFDFPGFGKSDEPTYPWSVTEFAQFVIKFIQKFDCKDEIVLLGHSFGGRVIIKMTTEFNLPFKISKIILVDSAGILPKRTVKYWLRLKFYKVGRKVLEFPTIKKMYPNALANFRKKMGSSDYSNASDIMRKCLVLTVNEDLEPLLNKIKQPTLLVWGENDTATPLSDAQIMERRIPDSGLVILKNAGHFSFLEQPYVFQQVVKSFLEIGE